MDAGAPAFSEVGVGEEGNDEREVTDKGNDEDRGKATVEEPVFPDCGVSVGIGIEEIPITTTGSPGGGTTAVLLPVLLGGGDIELLESGRGTEVSVTEFTGSGADPELAGGKLVTVGIGETVFVETPVLDRIFVLERTSVVLEGMPEVPEGIPVVSEGTPVVVLNGRSVVLGGTTSEVVDESVSVVPVNVGDEVKVDDGNCVDTTGLDPGGKAPGTSPLPLSGLSTHDFSCLTMSTPSTTVGVRVIVHV